MSPAASLRGLWMLAMSVFKLWITHSVTIKTTRSWPPSPNIGIVVPVVVKIKIIFPHVPFSQIRQFAIVSVASSPERLTCIRWVAITHRPDKEPPSLGPQSQPPAGRSRISRCCHKRTDCRCQDHDCSCHSAHNSPLLSGRTQRYLGWSKLIKTEQPVFSPLVGHRY